MTLVDPKGICRVPVRSDAWGLAAAHALALDTRQYDLGGSNIHNTGEFGWYQGKGVVVEPQISYDEFLLALPKVVAGTEATPKGKFDSMKLSLALAYTRRQFLVCHKAGGRVVFVGNGGSAAIASHMAVDYTKNGGVRAVAFNDVPTLTCLANDFGYDNIFSKQIEYQATKRDILVIISSSGRSLNIIAAATAASALGCKVFTFTGMNPNNKLRSMGDFNFWCPSSDYGLVELSHLTLLHAMVSIQSQEERRAAWPKKKK